jgi:hypothetical protein
MYGEDQGNVVVILAAAGRGDLTPKPGPASFTNAIMRECDLLLQEQPYVLVSALHERLGHRKAKLITYPIIINPSPATIKLRRVDHMKHTRRSPDSAIMLQLNYNGVIPGHSFEHLADSIAQWIGHNVPPWISSITAPDVVRTTKQSSQLVTNLIASEDKLLTAVSNEGKEHIVQAWDRLVDLMSTQQGVATGLNLDVLQERATLLLKRLDHANEKLLNVVADNVTSETALQALARNNHNGFELLRPVMLRRTIQQPQPIEMGITVGASKFSGRPKLLEFKGYRAGLERTDIEAAKRRVELLSGVLSSQKPLEYRCLPFASWDHEESNYRIVLKFDIPLEYDPTRWVSLREAIKITRKSDRPTLDERLRVAVAIAMAVYKWHVTGWVHQGIESHDILFFYKQQEQRLDYCSPFLGGFEFARPSQAPSQGSYVEDLDRDVYRHPERQGPSRNGHRKRHDLYSLGVVLLEIGLWQEATETANPRRLKDLGVKVMVDNLISAVTDRLAFYAGKTYADVVLRCLRNDFGVSLDDEAQTNLDQASRFLILDKLREGVYLR